MLAHPQLNRLRHRVIVVSISLLVPVAIAGVWTELLPWQAMVWMSLFSASTVWLSTEKGCEYRVTRLILVPLGTALGPWLCAANGVTPVNIATAASIPVMVAMLYIETFEVVLASVLAGMASLAAWFCAAGLPSTQVTMIMVSASGVGVMLMVTAWNTRQTRALERALETEHNQALRLSETRRAQAERLAIVGRLASGVAHEINNPLAFVKANVGALKRSLVIDREPLPEAELEEILSDTTQGIDRICQIVADLKGFSREDQGVAEPVDLREVLSGAVRLAQVRLPRQLKVTIELPPVVPLVRASPRKLAQVLLNLLVNAGDALEEARTANPQVIVRGMVDGGHLRLTVTDNGPGIPEALLPRMFEPFFTTKPAGKGTGLGLALSREYIEGFGGTLSVRNVEPSGAEFAASLRITAATGETPLPGTLPEPAVNLPLLARRRSLG